MEIKKIHYALQICDVKSYQNQIRYASEDRTEISKKCIKSFLESVKQCSIQKPYTNHNIAIIDDRSSKDLIQFVRECILQFTSVSIQIKLTHLTEGTGIAYSIEYCYQWLRENGKDLVYQVQDDYLFSSNAIVDMVDIYEQIHAETGSHSLISSWNDSWLWLSDAYRNKSTPRVVIVGKRGYWMQYYDISCSFLTSHEQFNKHWDLYDMFFYLIDKIDKNNKDLENKSLNYLLTRRGILGLVPINSVAFHLQSDLEKDPHIDYKPLWDSIDVT